jgi:hypothetical protein
MAHVGHLECQRSDLVCFVAHAFKALCFLVSIVLITTASDSVAGAIRLVRHSASHSAHWRAQAA